jgi:hypothetical protein
MIAIDSDCTVASNCAILDGITESLSERVQTFV